MSPPARSCLSNASPDRRSTAVGATTGGKPMMVMMVMRRLEPGTLPRTQRDNKASKKAEHNAPIRSRRQPQSQALQEGDVPHFLK